jgi:H+/Cl- antiporter ClcA
MGPQSNWGLLGWAKWLPEVTNAAVVALVLVCSAASVVPYSDDEIRQSLVDTYEPSAWNFMGACFFAVVGGAAGLVARVAAARPTRRRLATIQVAVMVVAVAVAGFGHHRLMQRTTRLTGQTFGGFP